MSVGRHVPQGGGEVVLWVSYPTGCRLSKGLAERRADALRKVCTGHAGRWGTHHPAQDAGRRSLLNTAALALTVPAALFCTLIAVG